MGGVLFGGVVGGRRGRIERDWTRGRKVRDGDRHECQSCGYGWAGRFDREVLVERPMERHKRSLAARHVRPFAKED